MLKSIHFSSVLANTRTFIKDFKATVSIGLLAGFGSLPVQADNDVMMQYFHWYLPSDGQLWNQVKQEVDNLSAVGITTLWLPPAYKGAAGGYDVGYGVYDMYDLGEFNQKGSIRTKYGTKSEYISAIDEAHSVGMQIYGDVVFNHRGGADTTESVTAVRVARDNRNFEFGGDVQIDAWTGFDFNGRGNTYSDFKWHWYHFDGVDWAQNLGESNIFKFRGIGKAWDWEVDTENQNYDYLMFADLDMDNAEVVQELKDWGNWYVNMTNVDGFRIDAVKHIKYDFFNEWLDHMRATTGQELFTVGELWSYDIGRLHNYIDKTGGRMSLFDAPLHNNFYQISNGNGNFDMREIMDNTLMKEQPALAVTLVDNHDTQQCQALESPVRDWFKPLAYAFILLRNEGYPNVFYADYYGATYTTSDNGCNNTTINIPSQKQAIDLLLSARQNYAYGTQIDYLDHWDVIGWTRLGNSEHPEAMAVIMTDRGESFKWMNVDRPNTNFVDITGNRTEVITTNSDGWGEFTVAGGSYSVWIEQPDAQQGEQGVSVNFSCQNAFTVMGQNVYVVGNQSEIGNWNAANAVKLDPSNYPNWSADITFNSNTDIEWKCIKKDVGATRWQSGANNTYTTPASGSGSTSSVF